MRARTPMPIVKSPPTTSTVRAPHVHVQQLCSIPNARRQVRAKWPQPAAAATAAAAVRPSTNRTITPAFECRRAAQRRQLDGRWGASNGRPATSALQRRSQRQRRRCRRHRSSSIVVVAEPAVPAKRRPCTMVANRRRCRVEGSALRRPTARKVCSVWRTFSRVYQVRRTYPNILHTINTCLFQEVW